MEVTIQAPPALVQRPAPAGRHGLPRPRHPLWLAPFRPLFAGAGICALLAPLVWLWPGDMPVDPRLWHLHELVFGMCGAALGGYLLTALPAWTGPECGRISSHMLIWLTLLWLAARLALPFSASLSFGPQLALALGYFILLAGVLARPLIAARLWGRLWAVGAVLVMALGNALIVADMRGLLDATALPLAMVLFFAALIGWVGGRAVPAFTRSWLQRRAARRAPRDTPIIAIAALVATLLGAGLVLADMTEAAGPCLIVAGFLQAARLAGWRSRLAWRYPALLMLHLAWLWLPCGLILLGTALMRPDLLAPGAALHALSMGAMGSMILAITARAAMARDDGRLIAGPALSGAFLLVWLSALPRVLAGVLPADWPDPVRVSAFVWMLGWVLFLYGLRPALTGPLPAPVLSAAQRKTAPIPEAGAQP